MEEKEKDQREERDRREDFVEAPHPPTDHNPYPYPLQQPNKKGWLKALIYLVVIAVVITLVCVVVGVYNHHEKSLSEEAPIETVMVAP